MANLTSTANIKAFLNISSSTYDTILASLNESISKFVENYIGYTIAETTYTNEEYDGEGGKTIVLDNFPITTFTSLEYRESFVNEDSWDTFDSEDYYVDTNSGVITLAGGHFSKGTKNYRATYKAGYSETPADLELAVWQLIRDAFNQRNVSGNVKSERLKDLSITYAEIAGILTDEVKAVLDNYKDQGA